MYSETYNLNMIYRSPIKFVTTIKIIQLLSTANRSQLSFNFVFMMSLNFEAFDSFQILAKKTTHSYVIIGTADSSRLKLKFGLGPKIYLKFMQLGNKFIDDEFASCR